MRMLAHPSRLMIVCRLLDGECSVGQLADDLGVRASTMSQHLAQLRQGGIVSCRKEAQTVYYKMGSDVAQEVMGVVYRHFCAPAKRKRE